MNSGKRRKKVIETNATLNQDVSDFVLVSYLFICFAVIFSAILVYF